MSERPKSRPSGAFVGTMIGIFASLLIPTPLPLSGSGFVIYVVSGAFIGMALGMFFDPSFQWGD